MKENFKMNSHIYKNATASMQPWCFHLSFERRFYIVFDVIHARTKKNIKILQAMAITMQKPNRQFGNISIIDDLNL